MSFWQQGTDMMTWAPDSTPTARASSVAVSHACRASTISGAGRSSVGKSLMAAAAGGGWSGRGRVGLELIHRNVCAREAK
jgi:hypothetical protein